MTTIDRRRDRGRRSARRSLALIGRELRDARTSAGLSQDALAASVGISGSTVGRIERAEHPALAVATATQLFAMLGHDLSVRAFPEGPPLRDVGQARLIGRFRRLLPASASLRTEVRIGSYPDIRAWDAVVDGSDWSVPLEAETVLYDLQATDRRVALKMESAGADRIILLVADTRRNRRVLREFRPLIAHRYPTSPRAALAAIRSGRAPSESAVIVL